MMNRPALRDLTSFLHAPLVSNLILVASIPTIHDVIEYEFNTLGSIHITTLETCRWIQNRGAEVLARLVQCNGVQEAVQTPPIVVPDPPGDDLAITEKDWRLVSVSFQLDRQIVHLLEHRQGVTTI